MYTIVILCLLFGVIITTNGWTLHRNCDSIGYPIRWEDQHPFKESDSFTMVILKGMSASILAVLVAAIAWLLSWLVGADGWSFVLLALLMLNAWTGCKYYYHIEHTLRMWWVFRTPPERKRIRQREREKRRQRL
jgi:hypothetical protein